VIFIVFESCGLQLSASYQFTLTFRGRPIIRKGRSHKITKNWPPPSCRIVRTSFMDSPFILNVWITIFQDLRLIELAFESTSTALLQMLALLIYRDIDECKIFVTLRLCYNQHFWFYTFELQSQAHLNNFFKLKNEDLCCKLHYKNFSIFICNYALLKGEALRLVEILF